MAGSEEFGSVPIQLDKPRHLKFDIEAISILEDMFEKSLGDILGDGNAGISTLMRLLYVGLLHEDTRLGLNQKRGIELVRQYVSKFAPGNNYADKIGYVQERIQKAIDAGWSTDNGNPQMEPGEMNPPEIADGIGSQRKE